MSLRIKGDKVEQHRIKLERDIAHTMPSPPSMSPSSARNEEDGDASSVDLPRHNSNPRHSFHSFEHPSYFESDFYSRHGDEDSIALDPDLGHTMSTAAHHASALTLTAGLRGREHVSKKPQINQEFDPERPLQPMLGAADGLSMFNSTFQSNTKSNKNSKLDQYTFDPIIVDSTAELDRFLRTGFNQPNTLRSSATYPYPNRLHSRQGPQMEGEDVSVPPKSPLSLSQALNSQFSPQRPRSTPASTRAFQFPKRSDISANSLTANPALSSRTETSRPPKIQQKEKEKENKPLTSIVRGTQSQARIHFQEPIDTDKTPKPRKTSFAPDAVSSAQRPALVDKSNKLNEAPTANEQSKTKVHLPDITNLTAAVESPMRGGEGYLDAKVANRRFAADVVVALDVLQSRLDALERDNGVARRRVEELEYDLEECKEEVAYGRRKMKARELNREAGRDNDMDYRHNPIQEEKLRYFRAVEENKVLETFVATMREHVTRLTSEVALQRSLINGLRQDMDGSEAVRVEVQALNVEVERLSGEVERLKTFIEDNVRERERSRDASSVSFSRQEKSVTTIMPSQVGFDITYVTNPMMQREERSSYFQREPASMEEFPSRTQDMSQLPKEGLDEEEPFQEPDEDVDDDEEVKLDTRSNCHEEEPSPPDDKPAETTELSASHSQRFIEDSELAKVQAEMLERRSERSLSPSGNISEHPSPALSHSRFGTLPSQNRPSEPNNLRNMTHRQTSDPLPLRREPPTQIRGSRMERLFFAVPDHSRTTCHICHRRKRRGFELNRDGSTEKDEPRLKAYFQKEGAGRKKVVPEEGGETKLPQTILAHVLRELEDDFSHYKAIYIELAEQYAVIGAVSNIAKRNILADHLREVIDSLEQKGDQIAALYELLHFRDKPLGSSKIPHATFV